MKYYPLEIILSLSLILLSCNNLISDKEILFNLHELKRSHQEIYETVGYWERNKLRTTLPFKKTNILRGFVLEYGNSNYKDYHSIVGIQANREIKIFKDKKEFTLVNNQSKAEFDAVFDIVEFRKNIRKNINDYVKDGEVYLLTLMTKDKILKIPYYAPDLGRDSEADEIILLIKILKLMNTSRTLTSRGR